jgi:hypothetical protein
MLQALSILIVIGVAEPMILVSENRMLMFNEFTVLVFTYHLLLLTDNMFDFDTRKMVGNSLVAVTLLNLGVNLLLRGS